jgi:hypothetical protein
MSRASLKEAHAAGKGRNNVDALTGDRRARLSPPRECVGPKPGGAGAGLPRMFDDRGGYR